MFSLSNIRLILFPFLRYEDLRSVIQKPSLFNKLGYEKTGSSVDVKVIGFLVVRPTEYFKSL